MPHVVSQSVQEVAEMEMVVVVEGEPKVCVEVGLPVLSPQEEPAPHRVVVEPVPLRKCV